MGQCWSSFWSLSIFRGVSCGGGQTHQRHQGRQILKDLPRSDLSVDSISSIPEPRISTPSLQRASKALKSQRKSTIFTRKPRIPTIFPIPGKCKQKYFRQTNDGEEMHELSDIKAPYFSNGPIKDRCNLTRSSCRNYQQLQNQQNFRSDSGNRNSSNRGRKDELDVGLRQIWSQSLMRMKSKQKHNSPAHQSLKNNNFALLDPRQLISASSQWSMDSTSRRNPTRNSNSSVDLEWENEDASIMASMCDVSGVINDPVPSLSCPDASTVDTCSVMIRSHASSQMSIPGLDWDEQGDAADLVSLSAVDTETEQLITEIEHLTSRALEETNQWTTVVDEVQDEATNTINNNSNGIFNKYSNKPVVVLSDNAV